MKRTHGEMWGSQTGGTGVPVSEHPKVSRKIRACVECKARKIKCEMSEGCSTCARCQRLDLSCVVNKTLQTLLDDESGWKSSMENSTRQLQAAVSDILCSLQLPQLQSYSTVGHELSAGHLISSVENPSRRSVQTHVRSPLSSHTQSEGALPRIEASNMAMTREHSHEHQVSEDIGNEALNAVPMGSLYEVTKLRNLRTNSGAHLYHQKKTLLEEDFISKGMVTLSEAQELFDLFHQSLNQYLWGGIALKHSDFTSVRRSSSLLSTAILTVAALHVPEKTQLFDVCYSEFTALVCGSMLDRYHSLDDVRALCIAAFWLSDVSWKLSGHAVRIATEMGLHQSFYKALKDPGEHYERAQLWYFLYVCDHHFSIAYGRPPVIQEDAVITGHEKFLQLPTVTQADFRLHSQIAVFIILTRIYNVIGPHVEEELNDESLASLRQFNLDLDAWRIKWTPKLATSYYIASYPIKGVTLHYHFAKLQLNCLSFREIVRTFPQNRSMDRKELANIAVTSAIMTLTLVLEEPDLRNALVGVPIYLHTMVTFAAVFLLKVAWKWTSIGLGVDPKQVQIIVERVIGLLNGLQASERHLAYHIAGGLSKMLGKFKEWENREKGVREEWQNSIETGTMLSSDYDQLGGVYNSISNSQNLGEGLNGVYGVGMEMYGFDEYAFPIGIFDFVTSQMPV